MREAGNKNKGKENGSGLAWESRSHCFPDELVITHTLFWYRHITLWAEQKEKYSKEGNKASWQGKHSFLPDTDRW